MPGFEPRSSAAGAATCVGAGAAAGAAGAGAAAGAAYGIGVWHLHNFLRVRARDADAEIVFFNFYFCKVLLVEQFCNCPDQITINLGTFGHLGCFSNYCSSGICVASAPIARIYPVGPNPQMVPVATGDTYEW